MNRLGKIVLLLVCMVATDYVAHAQADTFLTEEGSGIGCGETSVRRFALYYRNDRTDIDEEYLDNAVIWRRYAATSNLRRASTA